ncbi:MAG: hypothetical protein OXK81_14180 [Chloroflexota bacterium]|nr:hypothetical protein [Chloroflexota bacterium]
MLVPSGDTLCRFIRPRDWSKAQNRPRPSAFKQEGLSVWHKEELLARNVPLEDLRIEHLAGYGQAHYTTGDFVQLARKASNRTKLPLSVQVVWRPEDEYVAEPWRQWNYAHVQVETVEEDKEALRVFRQQLSLKAREIIPPDTI